MMMSSARHDPSGTKTDLRTEDVSKLEKIPTTNSTRGFGPGAGGGRWDSVLVKYVEHPEKFDKSVVYRYDDRVVVVYDAYPKVISSTYRTASSDFMLMCSHYSFWAGKDALFGSTAVIYRQHL
jgi:hypothetical protein